GTGDDPGERSEDPRDGSPHDRRLPDDRQGVGEYDENRKRLADQPAKSENPRREDDADGDDRDVLTGDREQVGEPARLEGVPQLRIEPGALAQDDPDEQPAPLSLRTPGQRPLHVRAQPIADATDPAPPADDAPALLAAQHDVHAATLEPSALVEAGLGPTRRDRLRAHVEDGPLRRRAAHWELEHHSLAKDAAPEAMHLGRRAHGERRAPNRPGK